MIRSLLTRLRTRTNGSVAMAPVFVITALVIATTVAATISMASVTAVRGEDQEIVGAAARSATAAVAAELNLRNSPSQVRSGITAGGYIPPTYLPAATEQITYRSFTERSPGVWELMFRVDAKSQFTRTRTYIIEYRQVGHIYRTDAWVPTVGAEVPTRQVWTAVRSIAWG